MVVAYLMMIVMVFVFINLVVDITYSILDPQYRPGPSRLQRLRSCLDVLQANPGIEQ